MNLFCCFGKRNTLSTEASLPPSLYPTESSQNKTTAKTGSVFQHFQKADSPSSPQNTPTPPRNPFQSPLHPPVATWYTADSPSSPQTTPTPPRNPFQSPLHSPVAITQGLSRAPKNDGIAIMIKQRSGEPQTQKPSNGRLTGLQFLQTTPKGSLQTNPQATRSPGPLYPFSLNN